jgi:hypothetical protein
MSTQHKPYTPTEIDDTEDRMGNMEQLDFGNRKDDRRGRAGDEMSAEEYDHSYPPERVREAGMTGGEALGQDVHEDGITQDDLSPETLLDEGGETAAERGRGLPADKDLSVVDDDAVGIGYGLDEAEMGRAVPLDGEPWNDSSQPLDRNVEPSGQELEMTEDEQGISSADPKAEAPLDSARRPKPRT